MKKFLSLIFVSLLLPIVAFAYTYNLSVSMIFRDEAPYLKEWIEFHHMLGVEHFYLYNNLSKDNYKEVLNPYIQSNLVELFEWNQESKNVSEWDKIQIMAYNDALMRAKQESKWLALLDSDEFLFPTKGSNLSTFLRPYEKIYGFGGLLVNWVIFGTSWVKKIPENKLLIETLIYSAGNGSNHFKTIFLTKHADYVCSPHFIEYRNGYQHYFSKGDTPPFVDIEHIRINHYWSRDEWYLNNVKIPRRLQWGTDASTCKQWAEAANATKDKAVLRFVKRLRNRVFKQPHQP